MASASVFSNVIFQGSATEEEIVYVINKFLPISHPDESIKINTIDLFCLISWLIYNQPAYLQDEDKGQAKIKAIIKSASNMFMESFSNNKPNKKLSLPQIYHLLLPNIHIFYRFDLTAVSFAETIGNDNYIEAISSLKLYLESYKKEIYTNDFITNLCNTLNFVVLPSFHNLKFDASKLLQDFVPNLFLPTVAFDRELSKKIILIYSIVKPVPHKIKKTSSAYTASKIFIQKFNDRMTMAYMHDVEHQRKIKENAFDDLIDSMNEAESKEAIIRKTHQHQEDAKRIIHQREQEERQRRIDEEEEQRRLHEQDEKAKATNLLIKHWNFIPVLIKEWRRFGIIDDIPTHKQLNAIHKILRKTFHPDKVQDTVAKAHYEVTFKEIESDFTLLLAYVNYQEEYRMRK